MKPFPLDTGRIHFVGIGGIGMSGIAEILHQLGCRVSGSDRSRNANVIRLQGQGIKIAIGHSIDGVTDGADVGVLVVSSAIDRHNPEVVWARESHIPVIRRADMLAELMRLKNGIAVGGAHGKTTTTSMIAAILDHAGFDPTVIIGGIINALKSNARLGQGAWMVAEADESDGTFERIPATITALTNMDDEHVDHYGDEASLHKAFQRFVSNIPFYGFCAACIDCERVQKLVGDLSETRLVTCGVNPQADIGAVDVRHHQGRIDFTLKIRRLPGRNKHNDTHPIRLPMIGQHNLENALVAIAVACGIGVELDCIAAALASFSGVSRRATVIGTSQSGITVMDDYAHHPTEIMKTLAGLRKDTDKGRLIGVFQPHRYSRLGHLFSRFCTCFNDADCVIVSDIYAAGEDPVDGLSRDIIVRAIREHGHRHVIGLESPDRLAAEIAKIGRKGDRVVCMGAGDITLWARGLVQALDGLAPHQATKDQGTKAPKTKAPKTKAQETKTERTKTQETKPQKTKTQKTKTGGAKSRPRVDARKMPINGAGI